ncbi:MAG: ChbG/HpnK family deacetylase [Bacteroidales bacterium]|nr:ChbG/HpnK family deacetylase [Bacteroidales bacterium]
MKNLLLVAFLCLSIAGCAQQPPPRLIIRADDMGSSHSANLACIETARKGIVTTIEVMAVTPWFPEAVTLLAENPDIEVGLHLTLTSEWDLVKWGPLTDCPNLRDKNGYFFPRLKANTYYPGQSVAEQPWTLAEIEKEFRAQIELALRNIPQLSHLTGHMGSIGLNKEVAEMTLRLAREYHLSLVDDNPETNYDIIDSGYPGTHHSYTEKEASFLSLLDGMEAGKTYCFLEHPAYDNAEMQGIHHKGYENVASDRQGVTDLFTSEKVSTAIKQKGIQLVGFNEVVNALPRSTPQAENMNPTAITKYLEAVKTQKQELHSLMVLRHGKVVAEHWFGEHSAQKKHVMWSVSKSFTSAAIGFAVNEKKLKVSDKVISFFPDDLPAVMTPNLENLEIRHLLTMTTGHATEPAVDTLPGNENWVRVFLGTPLAYEPGTYYTYNSIATYMLSAIIKKVSGEDLLDYLYPRLFRPLGITGATWDKSPQGIALGGWGLSLRTEDMAKFGQFMLQKGAWKGEQLLPEAWFEEATRSYNNQGPAWAKTAKVKDSDWLQGYGYQLWRCRHNAYRADGMVGQFIIVIPDKDAVVVTTANIPDMQAEINLIWKYILPAFK